MIVSGATLKTVLKRDNLIIGGKSSTQCFICEEYTVEKMTKPGLFKLAPVSALSANVYGMLVSINPEIMENCEVSYAHFIEPHSCSLPGIFVRPATKDFDLEGLEYIYKLYVLDGRVKK